jgi:hypothetical protein
MFLLIKTGFGTMTRIAIAVVVFVVTALPVAAEAQQSIPLDVNLGDAASLSATVTVE